MDRQLSSTFCIDVRSEPLRHRIEQIDSYETYGFAGFFGLPIAICDHEKKETKACCPVLIKPLHTIKEEACHESVPIIKRHQIGKRFFCLIKNLYNTLKYNLFTPFAVVETIGCWFGLAMGFYSCMLKQTHRFKKWIANKIKPPIKKQYKIDIPIEQQVAYAESSLKMIGLTKNFNPLVVFLGHGSVTENNRFASSLDCGACGGNHGGPNGQILVTILNSKEVREHLASKGIVIPFETIFMVLNIKQQPNKLSSINLLYFLLLIVRSLKSFN